MKWLSIQVYLTVSGDGLVSSVCGGLATETLTKISLSLIKCCILTKILC